MHDFVLLFAGHCGEVVLGLVSDVVLDLRNGSDLTLHLLLDTLAEFQQYLSLPVTFFNSNCAHVRSVLVHSVDLVQNLVQLLLVQIEGATHFLQ
jgi:hypothetical protein